jgi:rfaE bifunctional protein nucleotidyltransferase chain/domain
MNPKIKTREEISKVAEQLRKEGKKIVTTNGAFDILHYGHVKLFEFAKNQGDVLIVGLNSDKSIKSYKNKNRPIVGQEYRAEVLAAIQQIDYITIFDEPDCIRFVESVKPNVHVNAATYGLNCIESETVKRYGGEIKIFDVIPGHSTTELIKKIIETQK